MSGKQISLFKSLPEQELQSYITQIQTIKTASRGLFKPTPIADYANAIQGLEARQAALLLSTQGLTNAQIAETLAINESSVAKNYQAMADAGLLKRKQTLTAVQIQENLQTVLGAEADTSAAMSALGLSGAIEGQGYQTVKLTAKKLEEAVATNVLTEAQAKELAMRTGVTLSMTAQAAGSLPKWIAMIKAGTIAVWDQIKATAVWLATTPAGWAVSATAAIGGLIFTLDKLAQSEKKASDQAVELYENSKEKVKTNQEETDSLNELIEKYKELKSNSNLSSDNRNEIKQLQHDIAQLVGAEAQNLDLVNGKLDEQISKLQSIQAEKSKQNVEDARDNYYNAVYASDVITGGADKYGNDVSIKWNGAEARQIHKIEGFEHTKYNDLVKFFDDNGFGDIIRKNDNQTVMNMRFVVDTKDIDDIEQKIARLKEFKEFLADNGFKNTGLYQGVTSSIDRYSDQQNNELEAADILVNNIIENLSDSNEKLQAVSVESVQSFEEYRKKMLEELLKDNDISTALSSGLLSKEDLQKSIDGFMATCEDFSAQYEQWQNRDRLLRAVDAGDIPEAERLLELTGHTLAEVSAGKLGDLDGQIRAAGAENLAEQCGVGVPTLLDVAKELQKPGRDPRDELPPPLLRTDVLEIKDLQPGMVLTGTVRNVIDFGVFVDIGVHQDGLVHISQISKGKFLKHPSEAVAVGDIVKVKVLEVDEKKKRISLSMKQAV